MINYRRGELSTGSRPTGSRLISGPRKDRKKNWMFEKLEDRHLMSANPLVDPLNQFGVTESEVASSAASAASASAIGSVLPNDPYLGFQWHLFNSGAVTLGNDQLLQPLLGVAGEDLNVLPVWTQLGYTGAGVVVAVVDSGIQLDHPDLINNIHPFLRYDAIRDQDKTEYPDAGSPSSFFDPSQAHGTAVGGIIGATANNGIGTAGLAYNVQLVPIRAIDPGATTEESIANVYRFGLVDDPSTPYDDVIDIYNHSWGPGLTNVAFALSFEEALDLQRSALLGRNGLGAIHVQASGNGGSPGEYGYSAYNGYLNSMYVIGVTGVDHDGREDNDDGTLTQYPMIGPNVLVTAPTGSNSINIGNNPTSYGSGIWTTDFFTDPDDPLAEFKGGFNAAPVDGIDDDYDQDFLENPDYTSRFNGTSAAAPMVSGVIALMLEANPNLTFRDVEEILIRSARQNAPNESLAIGYEKAFGFSERSTWITNRDEIYRTPNFYSPINHDIIDDEAEPPALVNDGPLDNSNVNPYLYLPKVNPSGQDGATPNQYANGAGYTVSMGRGFLGSATGYAYGVVDATLAVKLAEQWTSKNQHLEDTQAWTTFTGPIGAVIPAVVITSDETGNLVVPGRLGNATNEAWYNEFGADDPFSGDNPPAYGDGSYLPLPIDNSPRSMSSVEWVEVKLNLSSGDIQNLRITLVSPNGVHSELNNHFDAAKDGNVRAQYEVHDSLAGSPGTNVDPDGGNFEWTYTTNRNWGERTDANVIIDPATGEPYPGAPERDWYLQFENYGEALSLSEFEVVFHGTPIGLNTKRIQGLVGVDQDNDDIFNFERSVQLYQDLNFGSLYDSDIPFEVEDADGNPVERPPLIELGLASAESYLAAEMQFDRLGEVERYGDLTQEKFAENVLVELWGKQFNGEEKLVDQFLTGHDGNFYFDVVPPTGDPLTETDIVEYIVRIVDGEGRTAKDDPNTPDGYLAKYKSEWTVTPDYFFAWDHDRTPYFTDPDFDPSLRLPEPEVTGNLLLDRLLEMPDYLDQLNASDVQSWDPSDFTWVWDPRFDYDVLVDPDTGAPLLWEDLFLGAPVEDHVRGINFLVTQGDPAADEVVFTGQVYSDKNGDGVFNGEDNGKGNVVVYVDANLSGGIDPGETFTLTGDGANGTVLGQYELTIPTTGFATYQIGIVKPNQFAFNVPESGLYQAYGGPGDTFGGFDFAIVPTGGDPGGGDPGNGATPGSIEGVVYNDINGNGSRQSGELGLPGVTVYIDANNNLVLDEDEGLTAVVTNSAGAYEVSGIAPGDINLRVVAVAPFAQTSPSGDGTHDITLPSNGSVTGVLFGLKDQADRDFGDLVGFPTLESENGAWHRVIAGVHLGNRIDGELDGQPNSLATGDDIDSELNDEDGVIANFGGDGMISDGETLSFTVKTAGTGYFLNAWLDFNGDGDWDDAGEHVYTDVDLNPGTWVAGVTLNNQGQVALPLVVAPDITEGEPIAARFRWGVGGLDYTGGATVGEVEDYLYGSSLATVSFLEGDYDFSGTVDQADYAVWRSSYGATGQGLAADGNGDLVVDTADYAVWRDNVGQSTVVAAPAVSLSSKGGSGATLQPLNAAQQANLANLGYEVVYQKIGFGEYTRYVPSYRAIAAAVASTGAPATTPSVGSDGTSEQPPIVGSNTGFATWTGLPFAPSIPSSVMGPVATMVSGDAELSESAALADRASHLDLALSLIGHDTEEEEVAYSYFDDSAEDDAEEALAVALAGDLFNS